ncbi:MAG: glycogen debranching N-terminal domain-containing protein, partial [Burkholderiales bacterium]
RPEKDDYSIIARASRAAERTRVLKHGDTFAVFDSTGDILPSAWSEQGLYHDGARFLCHFELVVNDPAAAPQLDGAAGQ